MSATRRACSIEFVPGAVDYLPAAHRWWRVREQSGTACFEAAPDGVTRTTRRGAPNPLSLTRVAIVLGAGPATAPASDPELVRHDHLNPTP